jgi:hypothetical protein
MILSVGIDVRVRWPIEVGPVSFRAQFLDGHCGDAARGGRAGRDEHDGC